MTDPGPPDAEPATYVLAHVREGLAADGRVTELGIEVEVVDARRTVVLMGTVGDATVRDAAAEVAAERAPGWEVRNDLEVLDLHAPPTAPEQLR